MTIYTKQIWRDSKVNQQPPTKEQPAQAQWLDPEGNQNKNEQTILKYMTLNSIKQLHLTTLAGPTGYPVTTQQCLHL